MHTIRGSVLVETCLTMTIALLLFLGLIKLTYVGYEQTQVDAAAFVAAHAAAISSSQASHAQAKVSSVFPNFPSANISLTTSTAGVGPNPNGDVVGYASRTAGGFFVSQGFGGSVFTLRSHVVEPAAAPTYSPGLTGNVAITNAAPPNCTTNNPATPSCSVVLATPKPSNSADPFYSYECHAIYYATLVNSGYRVTVTGYFPNASPSLTALKDGYGTLLTSDHNPWPANYQSTSSGSINSPTDRAAGKWFTEQLHSDGSDDTQNADGLATQGGGPGRMLLPIWDFGGNSDPC